MRAIEESLRRSEATSRAFLESASESIVVADATGRIGLVNARTEAMFGYGRAELIGQPVELLVPPALRDQEGRPRFPDRGESHRPRSLPKAYPAQPASRPGAAFWARVRDQHGIVRDHVTLDVRSEVGKGTIFTLTFPVGATPVDAGGAGGPAWTVHHVFPSAPALRGPWGARLSGRQGTRRPAARSAWSPPRPLPETRPTTRTASCRGRAARSGGAPSSRATR